MRQGNGQAVIGHGAARLGRGAQPGQHLPARDDAAAAVHDGRAVSGGVRKFLARGHPEMQLAPGQPAQQARQLDATYIVVLRMVGAGLLNQHAVTGVKPSECGGPTGQSGQIPLETGHEHGKGGHGDVRRRLPVHRMDHLGIADHKIRGFFKAPQRCGQVFVRRRQADLASVQAVANGLHLGQNEPPPRRARIKRHDEQQNALFRQQIAEQWGLAQGAFRRDAFDGRAYLAQAETVAGRGAYDGHGGVQAFRPVGGIRCFLRAGIGVRLVPHHHKGNLQGTQPGGRSRLGPSPDPPVRHQQGHVGPAHDLQAALRAQSAQFAVVVQTGGVQKDHRPQRGHFQRFFNRVCRCAGRIRNNGHRLPGQGVEQ